MKTAGSPVIAALIGSTPAGPSFLVFAAGAYLYGRLPQPVTVSGDEVSIFLSLFPPALIVGFAIAFLPNLIGTMLMAFVGESAAWARTRIAWTAGGALAGAGLDMLFVSPREAWLHPEQADWAPIFALVATAAICARVCRVWIDWEEQPLQA